MVSTRIPLATYRLQFNKNFTFNDATRILDYLRELGITEIYGSPILSSRRGSGHGYRHDAHACRGLVRLLRQAARRQGGYLVDQDE